MLVQEILNKKTDYEVIRASSNAFRAKAEINGRTIMFSAEDEDESGEWGIAFSEIDSKGRRTYKQTGSGGELEVFSMIKDCMLEFVERYQPAMMKFTADKDNGADTRANAYERLIKRFNVPGYTYKRTKQDNHDDFVFIKN